MRYLAMIFVLFACGSNHIPVTEVCEPEIKEVIVNVPGECEVCPTCPEPPELVCDDVYGWLSQHENPWHKCKWILNEGCPGGTDE